jgi:hypothetical protein
MAKRAQHDPTTGDPRKPFAGLGGPEGRHAQTHDVRREAITNPRGPDPERERREAIAQEVLDPPETPATRPADEDKELVERLDWLTGEELNRLVVLLPGSPLRQGAAYADLEGPGVREFRAMGGDRVQAGQKLVAKDDVDYALWNKLTERHRASE